MWTVVGMPGVTVHGWSAHVRVFSEVFSWMKARMKAAEMRVSPFFERSIASSGFLPVSCSTGKDDSAPSVTANPSRTSVVFASSLRTPNAAQKPHEVWHLLLISGIGLSGLERPPQLLTSAGTPQIGHRRLLERLTQSFDDVLTLEVALGIFLTEQPDVGQTARTHAPRAAVVSLTELRLPS